MARRIERLRIKTTIKQSDLAADRRGLSFSRGDFDQMNFRKFFSIFAIWRRSSIEATVTPSIPTGTKVKRRSKNSRSPKHLPITIYQQEYDYSCVAAVLQTVFSHYTGRRMSHRRAVRLTGCKPDGAELVRIARTMKKLCGKRGLIKRHPSVRKLLIPLGELQRFASIK
jgi:hypothetical protein